MYPAGKRGQVTNTQPVQDTSPNFINLKSCVIVTPCSANAPRVHQLGGRNATCSTTAGHVPAEAHSLYEYNRQGSGVALCHTAEQPSAGNV